MRILFIRVSFLFVMLFGSCATIPKQAPILSEELGIKLNSIEKSHLNLLHSFFNQKRELVDQFIIKEWIPTFAEEFFKNEKVSATWDKIVLSSNKEERLRFIVLLGPNLQKRINEKRLELIKPLDDLEKEIGFKISTEYTIAKGINNSLTSYLYSASKVEENNNRYLEMLNVTQDDITKALNDTENIINQLVNVSESIEDKEPKVRSYKEEINEIKNKIK